MNLWSPTAWVVPCAVLLGSLSVPFSPALAQAQARPGLSTTNDIWLEVIKGTVRISETGSGPGIPTQVSQVLRPSYLVRTDTNSFAEIRWSSGSRLSLGPAAEILVREHPAGEETGFHIFRGLLKFLHRNAPGRIHFTAPGADAGVDGTEFVIEVDDQDRTHLWVIEGKVG